MESDQGLIPEEPPKKVSQVRGKPLKSYTLNPYIISESKAALKSNIIKATLFPESILHRMSFVSFKFVSKIKCSNK